MSRGGDPAAGDAVRETAPVPDQAARSRNDQRALARLAAAMAVRERTGHPALARPAHSRGLAADRCEDRLGSARLAACATARGTSRQHPSQTWRVMASAWRTTGACAAAAALPERIDKLAACALVLDLGDASPVPL